MGDGDPARPAGPSPVPKAIVSWSTGNDSAFALHEVQRAGDFEIVGIVTTVTERFARVSMHGVREVLLDRQTERLGLGCRKVMIPSPCSNASALSKIDPGLLAKSGPPGVGAALLHMA